MAIELGSAYISILPSTSKLAPALNREIASTEVTARKGGARAGKGFSGAFKGGLGSLAKSVGPMLGIAGVAGIVGGIAKQGIAFQDSMNSLQAVSGATARQMKEVSKRATDLGNDLTLPGVSAADAGNAMLELSKGGLSVADSMKAAQGTLRLAGAASIDAAKAAEIQANALQTFGLKAKDAVTVSDQLANTANASSVEITDVAYSMQQAGAVFSSFQGPAVGAKKAMTELNTAVGLLGNAGIKGQDAGTSIKSMMMGLVQPSSKATRQLELLQFQQKHAIISQQQYDDVVNGDTKASKDALAAIEKRNKGIKVSGDIAYTASGKMKSLPDILNSLKSLTKGSSQADTQQFYKNLFGTDGIRAALVLTKQAGPGYAKMEKAVTRAGGAQKVAAAKARGLGGALRGLQSQFETIGLVIYQKVAPGIEIGVRAFSKLIDSVQNGNGKGGIGEIGKTFKKVGSALGDAFSQIGGVISTQLIPAFKEILPIVAPVAKFLFQMFASSLIGMIQGAAQAIKGFIEILSGVFKLVSALVHGDWKKAWGAFKQILHGALDLALGLFKVWWNYGIFSVFRHGLKTLLGLFKKIGPGLKGIAAKALSTVERLFENAFKWIGKLIWRGIKSYVSLWKNLFKFYKSLAVNGWKVLRSAFGGAVRAIKTVIVLAIKGYVGIWKALFRTILKLAKDGWGLVKTGFSKALGGIKTAFSKAVTGIQKVWDKIKSVAAKPVRFIVNTVYTQGIKKVVDAIPGAPNLPDLKFADGGPVTGGVKGKDSVRAWLMPGEHVWTEEEVRKAGGQKAMFAMRDQVRKYGLKGFDPDPAFAKGGALKPAQIARAQQFARNQVGKPYTWGGVGPGGFDCSGFMSGITNVLRGGSGYGTRYGATGSFPWPGFLPGPGQFTIGSTPNFGGSGIGHMAGTLGGMPVESYGGHGPSVSHRNAYSPGFSQHYHLGAGGMAAAKAGGNFFNIIGDVKGLFSKIGKWTGELTNMGGWGGMMKKMVSGIIGGLKSWVGDKLGAPIKGAAKAVGHGVSNVAHGIGNVAGAIFDNGGVLEPGALAINLSKKPEAIYNHKQFKAFAAEAGGAGRNRRAEIRITNWRDGTGYMTEIAEDAISGEASFQGTRRRMG